jgi:hypothetical protein
VVGSGLHVGRQDRKADLSRLVSGHHSTDVCKAEHSDGLEVTPALPGHHWALSQAQTRFQTWRRGTCTAPLNHTSHAQHRLPQRVAPAGVRRTLTGVSATLVPGTVLIVPPWPRGTSGESELPDPGPMSFTRSLNARSPIPATWRGG